MSATTAILRTDLRIVRREPMALFWILLFPTVLLVILGAIPSFREPQQDLGGATLVSLYANIVVLTAMLMAACQSLPGVLTTYRERGILRRISTTPASPSALLTSQFVVHLALVVVASVLARVVALAVYGVDLPHQPGGYLLTYVLAAASALSIGSVVSAVARDSKMANALGTIAFFPLMFTSGVWLPVAAMPDGLRRVVEWTPMGAAARALDQANAGDWPATSHLLVLLAWTAVAAAVAVRRFRWQ